MAERLIIGAIALAIGLTGCSATGGPPTAAPTTTVTGVDVTSSPVMPRTPEPADFRIDVIVTSKECFSPASCVYHYAIDPWPTASYPPQYDDTKLTVIYTVTGGDQDQVGNYTVKGDVMTRDMDAVVLGPDGATFTATVTQVIAQVEP